MNYLDWIVLFTTVLFIVLYGTWKTRKTATMEGYLKADNSMKWWMIGASIMATQASAITFPIHYRSGHGGWHALHPVLFRSTHCHGYYFGHNGSDLL